MEMEFGKRRPRSVYIEYLEKRIAPATFVVTNLNDAGAGSLRDAVDQANARPGADTIVFRGAATSGEIALSSGDIDITDNLKIKGPGAVNLSIDAQGSSRIFNIDDGTSTVRSVTISGLSLVGGFVLGDDGGGIRCRESLTLVNSVVAGCDAFSTIAGENGFGGGLDIVTDGQVVIRNSKIIGNTSDSGGGGMRAFADGGVQILNSIISGNATFRFGGGVYARVLQDGTGNIVVDGSTITDNRASSGGGIYANNFRLSGTEEIGKITVRKSLVSGNSAVFDAGGDARQGGGLFFSYGVALINRTTITGNLATDQGGGLSADTLESLTVTGSKFVNNRTASATGAGGGIYINGDGNRSIIQNSVFSSNVSSEDGGGIFAFNSLLTIQRSTISGNTAIEDGGGVYASQGSVKIDLSTVRDNQSGNYGGGVYTSGAGTAATDIRITRSLFTFNQAGYGGGGIDTRGDGSITISKSRFIQNVAGTGDGGGLYLRTELGTISIASSLFSQNTAADDGGGMALRASRFPITITNTVIRDNIAAGDGGGIALFRSELNLIGSTISGNIAGGLGGGIWSASFTPVTLNGSRVSGNIATSDPQISEPYIT